MLFGASLCSAAAVAQSNPSQTEPGAIADNLESHQTENNTGHCQAIAPGNTQLAALSQLCEFALMFRHLLPDFLCDQTTTSSSAQSTTVMQARVTFEKGHEHYSERHN